MGETATEAHCACCLTWIHKAKGWPTCVKHRGRIPAAIRAEIAAARRAGDNRAEYAAMLEAHRAVGGWLR
jgi:hypothetical protein